ncbi:hypothetical protein BGZ50_007554 [Haplosporangium sp. Z 11]|nr:hypothetical protein BGZ50_007554 [Haplosporangium sp. Z 11]
MPEIRTHIAQYLSVKDAISCAQVSKEWAEDFVCRVWHTVDFDVHKDFDKMGLVTVTKHGRHIRAVKNLKGLSQINAFRCPSVRGLKELRITLDKGITFVALCWDLISRSSSSLYTLSIGNPVASAKIYFSVDALIPRTVAPSRLTSLDINGFYLTRESFSSLLRGCTSLTTLSLWATRLDPGSAFDDYKHFGIKDLCTHAMLVIGDPSGSTPNSSLFALFPNIHRWSTYVSPNDSAQVISNGLEQCWPKLREISTNLSGGTAAKDLLTSIYRPLTSITIAYSEVSAELIHAVLLHQETLQVIYACASNSNNVGYMGTDRLQEVNDHFRDSGWIIQSILRQCSELKQFLFPGHEMDMDFVERSRWSCSGLICLRTRIRHLDTKEKVDAALTRWISARESEAIIDPNDKSIEARVARQLLKFDELTDVWLGS